MANETVEPSALSAALSAPQPFVTRFGGSALHAANRHVDRWAPESAGGTRPMRSLGFVDRLVAPWLETAQRSASMRLFNQYQTLGAGQRDAAAVSWVFPRPWYQDELDWMAAARQVQVETASGGAPTLLTTRGTFVAPQERPQQRPSIAAPVAVMPTALYEYVAPSLSVAHPAPHESIAGIGYGGRSDSGFAHDAYSPLIPLAAVQAAALMSRAIAPLVRAPATADGGVAAPSTVGRVSPALRQVLTTMLERATTARSDTRIAQAAPELVTPPAPRPDHGERIQEQEASASALANQYAEQRAQIADVQRIARASAERELAVRAAAQSTQAAIEARTEAASTAQRAEQREQQLIEVAQRTVQAKTAAERVVAAQAAAAAESARIEERIAERVAERTTGQVRLHEQARSLAAEHARTSVQSTAVTSPSVPAVVETARPPAEVTAAIASLPAELRQMLAERPERGMAAITELADALRTAELIARGTAANQVFQVTRGPQLVMPAGLGGLASAVERAQVIGPAAMFAPATAQAQLAPAAAVAAAAHQRAVAQRETRMPRLAWLNGATTAQTTAATPTTALTATAAATPAALGHVAWSDRWLARFAGASPRSLDILQAGSAASAGLRMQALAAAAPESVFVRPLYDTDAAPRAALGIDAAPTFIQPSNVAGPTLRPQPLAVERFDDDAETPDMVFAQIAAAAAGVRTAAVASAVASAGGPVVTVPVPAIDYARATPADLVAHGAPGAPNAGLSAQLAASPFALALRHVLSLPAVASFDVRALFGGGLSTTYLAGLLASSSEELPIAGSIGMPSWASFPTVGAQAAERRAELVAPALDLTYVAPESEAESEAKRPGAAPIAAAQIASHGAPLTTLRTALLSWQVDPAAPTLGASPTISATQSTPVTATAMRAMSDAMRLPILGGAMPAGEQGAAWTAPGMVAERAHGWSVAQERSASDLALDFVSPELVLAARVYGLGPTEAAQAARLAIAGPSQLGAMASTVDRTFVQAMAIASDRREAARITGAPGAIATAYPVASPAAPSVVAARSVAAPPALPGFSASTPDGMPPSTVFGVERRAPRGAFLWPSASVSALGLSAAMADGPQSMSVAALELLAAQAVAEIGTYAAFSDLPFSAAEAQVVQTQVVQTQAESGTTPGARVVPFVAGSPMAVEAPVFAEPAEVDVLGAAAALVPMARRARFDALYVALSQSPAGRTWSPAARAARALALAGRGEGAPTSAYERAASAWDVLPVVYATEGMSIAEIESASAAGTGTLSQVARTSLARSRGISMPALPLETRPGLSGLSARAGEALGSYVAPSTGELASAAGGAESTSSPSSHGSATAAAARSRELPIAQRAPTAAQELVRTGRPAGRHGGGEVEIPSWFESAARKMFDDRGNSTSSDGGFSMADLTLVTAAPPAAIAASTKAPHAAASPSPSPAGGNDKAAGDAIDVEKIAHEVYQQILVLMDTARSRNGEPYL